jgi:cyanophycinase
MKASARICLALWLSFGVLGAGAQKPKLYQYFRLGNASDVSTPTRAGFALMGGGEDLDEAFRWMCERSGGGDFLILRASGTDDYNHYVQGLCHQNPVATLIVPTRQAATDPEVAQIVSHAEAIFISGGDQSNYINFWKGTPVQDALNSALHRGVPIGGTSAGLAVLGEYIYSAQNDLPDDPNLSSKMALANPFHRQVVVVRGFLDIPLLANTITDTHFVTRDRLGRLLAMMARILDSGSTQEIKGIGVDERTAVLLEPTGRAVVVGKGAAYFLCASGRPPKLEIGQPLSFGPVSAVKLPAGGTFDVPRWKGSATAYTYTVVSGVVRSSRGSPIY